MTYDPFTLDEASDENEPIRFRIGQPIICKANTGGSEHHVFGRIIVCNQKGYHNEACLLKVCFGRSFTDVPQDLNPRVCIYDDGTVTIIVGSKTLHANAQLVDVEIDESLPDAEAFKLAMKHIWNRI